MVERNVFSSEKISKFLKIIEQRNPQSASDYYILSRYAIFNEKYLVDKKDITNKNITPPIYVAHNQIIGYLKVAHDRVFHGGLKKTYRACKEDVKNVKMKQVVDFIANCNYCRTVKDKRGYKKIPRHPLTRPIVSREYGSRGQADLIDVKAFGQTECCFILNYQDNLTRFCVLKPLRDKSAESVLKALFEIFNLLGAPKCLHTDNGGEFRNKKLTGTLKTYWPELIFIRGKPYNPRSQGAVERCNQDVKNLLLVYIDQQRDSSDYDFVKALSIIQFLKNSSFNRTIKSSPYKALFGQEPVLKLKSEHSLVPPSSNNDNDDDDDDDYDKNDHDHDNDIDLEYRQEFIEYCRKDIFNNTTMAATKMVI